MHCATTCPVLPRGRLRLAALADLPRIGFVAAASFYHSTFFPYARPFYAHYPTDTLASYRAEYREGILDPAKVVVVALDHYKKNEVEFVYDALKRIYPERWSECDLDEDGRIIVGVISMSLEMDPIRYGDFNPEVEGLTLLTSWRDPEDRGRDACPDALKMVEEALREPEQQHLSRHMEVLSLGVHPAYWKNGCGHELVKWCVGLADTDQVPLGVSCAPMGAKVCKSLGFVEKELVTIKGYPRHLRDITISFQQRSVLCNTAIAERGWNFNVSAQLRTDMARLSAIARSCAKAIEALISWELDPFRPRRR